MLIPRESLADRVRARMTAAKAARRASPDTRPPALTPKQVEGAHRNVVKAELIEVARHEKWLRGEIASDRPTRWVGPGAGSTGYRRQEMEAELRALPVLRAEIEADLDNPVTHDRYSRPISPELRAARELRTQEIREHEWRAAERSEAEGDHRRSRRHRHDALRARHIAEFEMKLRPALRGYSFAG